MKSYRKLQKLGDGTAGSAYLVVDTQAKHFVVKRVMIGTTAAQPDSTLSLLLQLRHPSICSLINTDYIVGRERFNLVYEYLSVEEDYRSLYGWAWASSSWTPQTKRNIMRHILEALSYCESQGVCHGNLSSSKVMFCAKTGAVKLLACGVTMITGSCFWARPYVSPECLAMTTCDVWAAGCVFIQLLEGSYIHPRILLENILWCMGAPREFMRVEIASQANSPPCGALTLLLIRKYRQGTVWDRVPRDLVVRIARDVWIHWRFQCVFQFPAHDSLYYSGMSHVLDLCWTLLTLDPSKRPSAAQSLEHRYFL